jgi:hypothetical protein
VKLALKVGLPMSRCANGRRPRSFGRRQYARVGRVSVQIKLCRPEVSRSALIRFMGADEMTCGRIGIGSGESRFCPLVTLREPAYEVTLFDQPAVAIISPRSEPR